MVACTVTALQKNCGLVLERKGRPLFMIGFQEKKLFKLSFDHFSLPFFMCYFLCLVQMRKMIDKFNSSMGSMQLKNKKGLLIICKTFYSCNDATLIEEEAILL